MWLPLLFFILLNVGADQRFYIPLFAWHRCKPREDVRVGHGVELKLDLCCVRGVIARLRRLLI